jgi:NTE family protein
MTDLEDFLATVGAFDALDADERAAVAACCRERSFAAGQRLLAQGSRNQSLFVLRVGQLSVRARQGDRLETIAQLNPPAVVGEISFLTGRSCSADVDVLVDATVVELPLEGLTPLGRAHQRIVHGLIGLLADRLHGVVTGAGPAALVPVVVISPDRAWQAPRAFAREMARALAYESGGQALLVRLSEEPGDATHVQIEDGLSLTNVEADLAVFRTRAQVAERLPEWTQRFSAIVIASDLPYAGGLASLTPFATHICALVGPGDPLPFPSSAPMLVAQDDRQPTLPVLDGTHRLIADVAAAEAACLAHQPPSEAFRAGVGSLARAVLDQQIGLALGAGGGRGWCHVGVLAALHGTGLPIDVIAGTSMGAVIGGLWASGVGVGGLEHAAREWQRRLWRLREWRLWRMHMANERQLEALMRDYFGDRVVNATRTPFWANATDIETGEEVVLRHGPLHHAVRASMAFPGWTPPVRFDKRLLIDGAVVNPAPARAAREMGAAFVVTVLALGPSTPQPLATRFPARAYDLFARTFHHSSVAMGRATSDANSDAVIVPDLGDATMLSFDRSPDLIAAGQRAADAQLPAVIASYARFTKARRRRSS